MVLFKGLAHKTNFIFIGVAGWAGGGEGGGGWDPKENQYDNDDDNNNDNKWQQ